MVVPVPQGNQGVAAPRLPEEPDGPDGPVRRVPRKARPVPGEGVTRGAVGKRGSIRVSPRGSYPGRVR